MLCIVPSVGLALTGFEGPELRYASGLFNLMRNLGGAIGIAVVNTWLGDQARIHATRIGESLGADGAKAPDFVAGVTRHLGQMITDPAQALLVTQAELARVVSRAALTSAFDEVFQIMAWVFAGALLLAPFCSPNPRTGDPLPKAAVDTH
jgi:DHA2 family multidrug resistance protein